MQGNGIQNQVLSAPLGADDDLILDLSLVESKIALRTWLVYHNISDRKLARLLGVSPSTLSRIISGERRSPEFSEILRSLGVPEELLSQI